MSVKAQPRISGGIREARHPVRAIRATGRSNLASPPRADRRPDQPPKTCPSSPTALISVLSASTGSTGGFAAPAGSGGPAASMAGWSVVGSVRGSSSVTATGYSDGRRGFFGYHARGPVAQRQSRRLLISRSWVQVPPGSPDPFHRPVCTVASPSQIEGGRGIDRADQPLHRPGGTRPAGPDRTAVTADVLNPPGGGRCRSRRRRARAHA